MNRTVSMQVDVPANMQEHFQHLKEMFGNNFSDLELLHTLTKHSNALSRAVQELMEDNRTNEDGFRTRNTEKSKKNSRNSNKQNNKRGKKPYRNRKKRDEVKPQTVSGATVVFDASKLTVEQEARPKPTKRRTKSQKVDVGRVQVYVSEKPSQAKGLAAVLTQNFANTLPASQTPSPEPELEVESPIVSETVIEPEKVDKDSLLLAEQSILLPPALPDMLPDKQKGVFTEEDLIRHSEEKKRVSFKKNNETEENVSFGFFSAPKEEPVPVSVPEIPKTKPVQEEVGIQMNQMDMLPNPMLNPFMMMNMGQFNPQMMNTNGAQMGQMMFPPMMMMPNMSNMPNAQFDMSKMFQTMNNGTYGN
ncbi:hypothetical protein PCE1_004590 [Barthelona sp. PCE]